MADLFEVVEVWPVSSETVIGKECTYSSNGEEGVVPDPIGDACSRQSANEALKGPAVVKPFPEPVDWSIEETSGWWQLKLRVAIVSVVASIASSVPAIVVVLSSKISIAVASLIGPLVVVETGLSLVSIPLVVVRVLAIPIVPLVIVGLLRVLIVILPVVLRIPVVAILVVALIVALISKAVVVVGLISPSIVDLVLVLR